MQTAAPFMPCACSAARRVARVLTQLYDSRLRASGLEAPQFSILLTLDEAGPRSQVTLARWHALDKTTVSRNLKLLESKGWIVLSGVEDRRIRQFKITAAGRKRLMVAKPEWKKTQDQLRLSMGGDQWEALFRSFQTLTSAVQVIDQPNGEKA